MTLLASVHGNKMKTERKDFPLLFSPVAIARDMQLPPDFKGVYQATELSSRPKAISSCGLVRVASQRGRRFVLSALPFENQAEQEIVVTGFPRSRDFLRCATESDKGLAYTAKHSFSIRESTIDHLPSAYVSPTTPLHFSTCYGSVGVSDELCSGLVRENMG